MTVQYIRQRGETIVIGITDSGAEPGDEGKVTAGIKLVENYIYPTQPSPKSAPAKTFSVTFRPATNNNDPVQIDKGWDFELTASESAMLMPGTYQFDYSIMPTPDDRFISDAATLTILEPASL